MDNYRYTFHLMKAYQKLGAQKCRIISFLFERDVYHGGYTDLTFDLGMNTTSVSNVRKAVIELSKIGVLYIDHGNRAEYDDYGFMVRSAPMKACFLVDGWLDYLMMWYKEVSENDN